LLLVAARNSTNRKVYKIPTAEKDKVGVIIFEHVFEQKKE